MTAVAATAEYAANSAHTRIWRRVASFPVALSALLVLLSFLTIRSRFDDPDLWWHLRIGQIVWTTHAIPTVDVLSYTTGHHAWVPHEWLSQTSIFLAYHLGGYGGLMLWLALLTSAILVCGYALCSLYSGNAKVSFLGALCVWLFSTIGLAIRPQMIGYFLLLLNLLIVHLGRNRNPRWFLALPPLFALWVNCHGSFFFGLILDGLLLLCSWFPYSVGLLQSAHWEKASRRLFAWGLALSLPALLLNPVGVQQILYPLDTMLHQPIGLSAVQEWQPLQITDRRAQCLLVVLGAILLLTLARKTVLYWEEVLLLAAGIWLAASHQRMLFVFGILAAPVLARVLSTAWEGYDPARDRPWMNLAFITAALVAAVVSFPGHSALERQVGQNSPVRAVDFIHSHKLSGNLLNEYVYGGYLAWAAPDHPVFVDGRADVFEWTGVLGDYERWATLESDPNNLLDRYGIKIILLSRTSPMARVVPLLHAWTSVYSDDQSVIFVRSTQASGL